MPRKKKYMDEELAQRILRLYSNGVPTDRADQEKLISEVYKARDGQTYIKGNGKRRCPITECPDPQVYRVAEQIHTRAEEAEAHYRNIRMQEESAQFESAIYELQQAEAIRPEVEKLLEANLLKLNKQGKVSVHHEGLEARLAKGTFDRTKVDTIMYICEGIGYRH